MAPSSVDDWQGNSNSLPHWAAGTLHPGRRPSLNQLARVLLLVVREGPWVQGSQRVDGGLSDRFTGIITHFAAAVAANATFLLDWPDLQRFYRPRFEFMYGDTESTVPAELLRLPLLQQFDFQADVDSKTLTSKPRQGLHLLRRLRRNRLTVARAGHGFLNCFWRESCVPIGWNTTRLTRMTRSIPFRNAFRILFDTLFEPTAFLKTALPDIVGRFFSPESKVKVRVLIQIRAGDHFITGNVSGRRYAFAALLRKALAYFSCAAKVTASYGFKESDALWFLMTDSEDLKRIAKKQYGDKLITNSAGRAVASIYDRKKGLMDDPLLHVISEQWIGSHCDYFVVPHMSGLGRQSAFRSRAHGRWIWYGDQCRKVPWSLAARDWSEI
eukprot:TRINITY_DN54610_c0_g1_i1.p1 TRINITY_DN54610_c0_g1~~TRINITY_DN54610_c0_g1_i1.p1  ORF type:complete len:384 (-),score=18.00 TRINITY_DN54610_c0_g1_i1:192-1343(-)